MYYFTNDSTSGGDGFSVIGSALASTMHYTIMKACASFWRKKVQKIDFEKKVPKRISELFSGQKNCVKWGKKFSFFCQKDSLTSFANEDSLSLVTIGDSPLQGRIFQSYAPSSFRIRLAWLPVDVGVNPLTHRGPNPAIFGCQVISTHPNHGFFVWEEF